MTVWLTAYLLTVAFELPIFAFGMRRVFPDGRALIALTFCASLITHPILWFCTKQTGDVDAHLLLSELVVALVEALFLFALWSWKGAGKPSPLRCLAIGLTANAFSLGLGLLLFSY